MDKAMKTIQVPTELIASLGMKKNDTLEMYSPEEGILVIRVLHDTGEFVCNRVCNECPFGDDPYVFCEEEVKRYPNYLPKKERR